MNIDVNRDELPVKDLYLAAFLYSSNLKLLCLRKESDFFWFIFEDKHKAEQLANQFWRKEAEGNIKVYAEALRTLKDRLFAEKGQVRNG
ncbi:MAG: hypothetical protein ISS45_05955 [Candidatus Omnitrophica bacterium]|nr:hypothetical protein [Candidatus Omnitrophota bacterium]